MMENIISHFVQELIQYRMSHRVYEIDFVFNFGFFNQWQSNVKCFLIWVNCYNLQHTLRVAKYLAIQFPIHDPHRAYNHIIAEEKRIDQTLPSWGIVRAVRSKEYPVNTPISIVFLALVISNSILCLTGIRFSCYEAPAN